MASKAVIQALREVWRVSKADGFSPGMATSFSQEEVKDATRIWAQSWIHCPLAHILAALEGEPQWCETCQESHRPRDLTRSMA